ncbi:MAG: hypothetical protein KDC35_19140 [Acidobacteria bacterium]|nr:hypothetical protein [Acidobacteriota bacterium]
MLQESIIQYLVSNIEPIRDLNGDKSYRCSVRLKDDLQLPCVVMKNSSSMLDHVVDAFRDLRREGISDSSAGHQFEQYLAMLRTYVLGGNRISWHHIAGIGPSAHAIPMEKIRQIKTEPNMTWIAFNGVMDDGHSFAFGTPFATEFFEMPKGYDASRIVEITPLADRSAHFYREKTYFECYIDDLP